MTGLTYDTGALIAAENDNRLLWALHSAALDRGLTPTVPADLAQHTRLPAGHWIGERAATDILVLAAKRRAFRSLHTLTVQQGGGHVLYGSALALAAAVLAWSRLTGKPITELTRDEIR